EAVGRPAEEPGNDDQVAGAADGQELPQPLDDAENDRLEAVHDVVRWRSRAASDRVSIPRASRMGMFASVHGEVVPVEETRVAVLDNGFTFGDSAYETIRTYRGRPFEWGRHVRRLRASAGRLGFEIPLTDAELLARLDAVLRRAGNPESYIRL